MDKKLKLLEMIQEIIKRMANNSFMLKGWSVTLVTAMMALFGKAPGRFSLAYYIPIIMFWFLDSYYLQVERKYRVLYKRMANASEEELEYTLALQESNRSEKTAYDQSLFSKTELAFYLPLAILTTAAVFAFC